MDELLKWATDNKIWEWLFSGAGLVLFTWIVRVIRKKRQAASSQEIRSGSNSTNIQAGRDIKIKSKTKLN
ncbi:MAG: hypothetical protein ROZ09_00175 [Thiobacillus sp.]|uniref:hypothetical protein n=1 Tax=Thiobacillus sp. TaxID=924 RepID=UPI0028951680|nr:hypothetical protein [Thiobacillus sp.]MDT3705210.1 hypothetical protein [Thiobacillus sp.]